MKSVFCQPALMQEPKQAQRTYDLVCEFAAPFKDTTIASLRAKAEEALIEYQLHYSLANWNRFEQALSTLWNKVLPNGKAK